MKLTNLTILTSFFWGCLLYAGPAVTKTSGGWGESSEYGKQLKSGARETVTGNVLSFDEVTPLSGMEPGVQVKLQIGKRDLDIHLGPRWFVLERDLNITRGQPLSIVGLRIQLGKKPVLVAEEIRHTKGDSIIIREKSGELKREKETEPEKNPTSAALHVLWRQCSSCHQKKDHPGAKFLGEQGLSDKMVVKKMIAVLESGKMPPAHKNFKDSLDGKLVLEWLRTQEKEM